MDVFPFPSPPTNTNTTVVGVTTRRWRFFYLLQFCLISAWLSQWWWPALAVVELPPQTSRPSDKSSCHQLPVATGYQTNIFRLKIINTAKTETF